MGFCKEGGIGPGTSSLLEGKNTHGKTWEV